MFIEELTPVGTEPVELVGKIVLPLVFRE